ncbi:MAG: glutamate racemase [Treponema sp.]|nr:MAG: glutamate racemase [Treponema sp.]
MGIVYIMKKNIKTKYAFIDSGLGGLAYLKALKQKAPNTGTVYIADNANFPYGTKSEEELIYVAVKLVEKVINSFEPEVIILACNTISVTALAELRRRFPVDFVGTVPAIKPAVEKTATGQIGIIASEKTIKDNYTKELIAKFGKSCKFSFFAGQKLIQEIENGLMFKTEAEKIKAIEPAMTFFYKEHVDSLVLACTHFLLINDVFKKKAEPQIKIIESVDGVIRQTLKISPPQENKSESSFFFTKNVNPVEIEKYSEFASAFGLNFKGLLK